MRRSEDFYETVNARRTLRFFSSDSIPRNAIRNIIKAAGKLLTVLDFQLFQLRKSSTYITFFQNAGTSPSGAHTEPWTFVAVFNKKLKEEIREIVEHEEEINYKKRMGKKWTTDLKPLKTDWHKDYLSEAPCLLLVFKQDYGFLPNGKRKVHYYKEMSVAIACGILITAIQVKN